MWSKYLPRLLPKKPICTVLDKKDLHITTIYQLMYKYNPSFDIMFIMYLLCIYYVSIMYVLMPALPLPFPIVSYHTSNLRVNTPPDADCTP